MAANSNKLKVGISGCLHGQEVRYDGTHRYNASIVDHLDSIVEWVVVCPEFDSGMGVPRETIHLRGSVKHPRVETTETKVDKTHQLVRHCQDCAAKLATENLAGFILKARSPSCGNRVIITLDDGSSVPNGQGVFVAALKEKMPQLPIVNEEEINTDQAIEKFVESMKAYRTNAT